MTHPPGLFTPLLRGATSLYERELAKRNARYDAGKSIATFDRPVISVGNLSTGGTGKTPMVRWIVQTLRDHAHTPAIAMRGYGAKQGQRSDEHDEYHRAFPEVPVVAQPDRASGLVALFATDEGERVDCVVLDDGFQHRRIARQLDLVLIDASRNTLEDACIPLGRNREPVANLARADHVILTHAEARTPGELQVLSERIEDLTCRPPISIAAHAWEGYESAETKSLDTLDSTPTAIVCAIGNPDAFLTEAQRVLGGAIVGRVLLRDHDPYRARTIASIRARIQQSGARRVLTTNKDWSKLRRFGDDGSLGVPVVRPRLAHRFLSGEDRLRERVLEIAALAIDEPHDGATRNTLAP